ncbi:MAG: hypothetical protein ACK5NK_15740, partial [Niabella sp.]
MLLAFSSITFSQQGQFNDCSASLIADTLTIFNSSIEKKWKWNNGDIAPISIQNKLSGQKITFKSITPEVKLPAEKFTKNIFVNISKDGSFINGIPNHL